MTNPATSLRGIFGEGIVFDPVPCFEERDWLFPDRPSRDALSGGHLALAQGMPLVCHADAATPRVLRLLSEAGHHRPERLHLYRTGPEYRALLDRLVADGWKIALQHAHAEGVIPEASLWIPSALLRDLNDKGRLARLAPAEALPARRIVPAAAFARLEPPELPLVAKVSSRSSSGAGCGVRVCFTPEDWRRAQRELARAPAIVLEEWLEIETSWCVQFTVAPDGRLEFLGAAEQVTGSDGSWHGNWIDDAAPSEAARLGREVVEAASKRGYRGVAGIDVARCRDGRLRVLDTNFRLNGSTVPLVLRNGSPGLRGGTLRSASWPFRGAFEEMARAVHVAFEEERFVPIAAWDPRDGAPRVNGMVPGATREEVARRLRALERAGFGHGPRTGRPASAVSDGPARRPMPRAPEG